jgi:hypothetical protein
MPSMIPYRCLPGERMGRDVVDRMLLAMLGSTELVSRWWGSPNKAFDLRNPSEVWEDDPMKVYHYVLGYLQR